MSKTTYIAISALKINGAVTPPGESIDLDETLGDRLAAVGALKRAAEAPAEDESAGGDKKPPAKRATTKK
jgi:hypothetical protein